MAGHEHTKRCYWDFREARWVCRAARAEDDPVTEFPAAEVRIEEPVGVATES